MAVLFVALIALLAWRGLGFLHASRRRCQLAHSACSDPAACVGGACARKQFAEAVRIVLLAVAAIAAPVLFLGIELSAYRLIDGGGASGVFVAIVVMVAGLLLFWRLFDINFTAPHRFYRKKLGEAYLVQPDPAKTKAPLHEDVSLKLAGCNAKARAPYHLVNCALNVPGSRRLADAGAADRFLPVQQSLLRQPVDGLSPHRRLGSAQRRARSRHRHGDLRSCRRAADGARHHQESQLLARLVQRPPRLLDQESPDHARPQLAATRLELSRGRDVRAGQARDAPISTSPTAAISKISVSTSCCAGAANISWPSTASRTGR